MGMFSKQHQTQSSITAALSSGVSNPKIFKKKNKQKKKIGAFTIIFAVFFVLCFLLLIILLDPTKSWPKDDNNNNNYYYKTPLLFARAGAVGDLSTATNNNQQSAIVGGSSTSSGIGSRKGDETIIFEDLSWSRPEELTTGMPSWMKEYFQWHAKARDRLKLAKERNSLQEEEGYKSYRYLMLQCLPGSKKCGGTADRLKPLPLMLWMAYQSNRILLIKWGRPAELEEFLLPPTGGLDWRVPDWLYRIPEFKQGPRATNVQELQELTLNSEYRMVKARVQTHDHGSQFYNNERKNNNNNKNNEKEIEEPTFERVYHICWRAMFTPAPPVGQLIQDQLQESHLIPGQYVGIHIRALYGVSDRDHEMVAEWTRNAIHCASQLRPGKPMYLASDSSFAIQVGKAYRNSPRLVGGARVESRRQERQQQQNYDEAQESHSHSHAQPYHLDKAPRSATAADFYDTFVDLYLLAMGRCVTYNMGGFGTWALLISPYANSDGPGDAGPCSFQHHDAMGIHKCEWVPSGSTEQKQQQQQQYSAERLRSKEQSTIIKKSLFAPPMT